MKTYIYRFDYMKGEDEKQAEINAPNENEAGVIFLEQHPDISPENILGVSVGGGARKNAHIIEEDASKNNNITANTSSNDYKTSTGFATLVSFLGWVVILISVAIIGFIVIEAMPSSRFSPMPLMAIVPMLGLFMSGVFLVIAGQITRAILDNTNYSKQMLDIMKRQQ